MYARRRALYVTSENRMIYNGWQGGSGGHEFPTDLEPEALCVKTTDRSVNNVHCFDETPLRWEPITVFA